MPYNFVADSCHTKKLCSRLSWIDRSVIWDGKRPFCVFESPLGVLGATYDDHLRLTGKRVDFLLVLIKLFFARRYRWGATSEYRFKIGDLLQRWSVDPKFQVEGIAFQQPFSSQKTRLIDLSYGIKLWTDFSSVLSQPSRLTDGQTEFSSLDRICIPCSAVKMAFSKWVAYSEIANNVIDGGCIV